MANDYMKKEPTKAEKMIYELAMHQQMLDRNLVSNSAHIVAMGILLNIAPEKVAEILVSGDDKIKEYGKKINEEIDRLTKDKSVPPQPSHGEHGHDHNHVQQPSSSEPTSNVS